MQTRRSNLCSISLCVSVLAATVLSPTTNRLYTDTKGKLVQETRTFSTMTCSLHQLTDWLVEAGITHLVMESSGDYRKGVYNILGVNFEVWLVNAHHYNEEEIRAD